MVIICFVTKSPKKAHFAWKFLFQHYLDWDGLENLIKGLYLTLKKQKHIADIPEMFDLIDIALEVMICEVGNGEQTVQAGLFISLKIHYSYFH